MIDANRLAVLPKYEPLRMEAPPKVGKCALCDGPIEPYERRVRLPARAGLAHPHCAQDEGWTIT